MVSRTHPTVYSSPLMNRRKVDRFEVRLSLSQVLLLIGIVTGSMATAFYFGIFSGRELGRESALEESVAQLAKLPIDSEPIVAKAPELQKNEALAKMGAEKFVEPLREVAPSAIPELKTIPSTQIEPEGGATEKGQGKTGKSGKAAQEGSAPAEAEPGVTVKVLGAQESRREGLDAVLAQREMEFERGEKAPQPKKDAATPAKTPKPDKDLEKFKSEETTTPDIAKGWYAQVAAPNRFADAQSLAQKLKSSGFPVVIEQTKVNGQGYFRVLVGPEGAKGPADQLVQQLKREKYVKGTPFLKQVK